MGPSKAACPGRYINARHCGGLSVVLLHLKDALELSVKRREFLSGCRFRQSRRDMSHAVKSNLIPKSSRHVT